MEVVPVAVAAVEVERQTVAVLRVEVPSRYHAAVLVVAWCMVGVARPSGRHRLVAVSRAVAASPIAAAASRAVRRGHRPPAGGVAVVLRGEVVLVAAAAAVHQRTTLGHRRVPVEPQVVVEARACLLRQQTRVCRHRTTHQLMRATAATTLRYIKCFSCNAIFVRKVIDDFIVADSSTVTRMRDGRVLRNQSRHGILHKCVARFVSDS